MDSILSQTEVLFVHILLSHTTEYKYRISQVLSQKSDTAETKLVAFAVQDWMDVQL